MTTEYRLAARPSSSLDVKKRNRNSFCGRWTLRGLVTVQDQVYRRFMRLGCKCWTCSGCGPRKAKRIRRAIIECATEKGLSRFLTLTLDPSACEAEESIPYIRRCWDKFRTYLKRRYRVALSFITVLELQKSGYAHLHVLIGRFIEQTWISEAWQAVGGGRIVYIKQVEIRRIGPYLSKYLTKDLLRAGHKSRFRRVTSSRDVALNNFERSGTWSVIKFPLSHFYSKRPWNAVNEIKDESGELTSFDEAYSGPVSGQLGAMSLNCPTTDTNGQLGESGRQITTHA
jgi:hypothetical protein